MGALAVGYGARTDAVQVRDKCGEGRRRPQLRDAVLQRSRPEERVEVPRRLAFELPDDQTLHIDRKALVEPKVLL